MGRSRSLEATEAPSAAARVEANHARDELAAARSRIAALEAQLAEAKKAAPLPTDQAVATGSPDSPTDLNTIFEQAKPLLKTLGPFMDNARRRGSQARAERRVAEWTEKYALTPSQQESIKTWFASRSEAEAARARELMEKPGANLQELMAAGRGQRSEEGLDEMMETTLSADQLTAFKADRLQERAASVEKEANGRVAQLNQIVPLDDAQQDQVFAIMARSSRDYDPTMQLEGIGADPNPLAEGESRDEAILAVLRPDQRAAYEADRQRRRDERTKNLESLGLKLPADLNGFEPPGR